MLAYVDTSCVAAIAFGEPGSAKLAKRLGEFERLVSSNLLEAELRAALTREDVRADCEPLLRGVAWVYPNRPLTREFIGVLEHGHVRGADLWHLACALFLKRRLGPLAFVTLDARQTELASALGFDAPE